jgi:hypothetical protein
MPHTSASLGHLYSSLLQAKSQQAGSVTEQAQVAADADATASAMQAKMEEAAEFHEIECTVRDDRIRELESQVAQLTARAESLEVRRAWHCSP